MAEVLSDCESQKALYFIDILGSSSWAHPIFIEFLCRQIEIYTKRNRNVLYGGGKDVEPKWRHTDPVELALQNTKSPLSPKPVGIQESKVLGLDDVPKVELDVCRILIWSKEDLDSVPGELVIRLHRAFRVPLFYIDKDALEDHLKPPKDFHLVFNTDDISKSTIPIKTFVYYGRDRRVPIADEDGRSTKCNQYLSLIRKYDLLINLLERD